MRYWIGLTSGALSNADDPLNNYIMFRYSYPAGVTGFRAVTDNGTQNIAAGNVSGVTIATNTDYTLKIRVTGGNTVWFSVNGGSETQVTSNVTSSDMGFTVQGINSAAGSTHSINVGKFYCEQSQG